MFNGGNCCVGTHTSVLLQKGKITKQHMPCSGSQMLLSRVHYNKVSAAVSGPCRNTILLTAPQGHKTARMKENKMHFDEIFGKLNDQTQSYECLQIYVEFKAESDKQCCNEFRSS